MKLRVVENVGKNPEGQFPRVTVDRPVKNKGRTSNVLIGERDFPLLGFDGLEKWRNVLSGGRGEREISREGGENFAFGYIARACEGARVMI